MKEGFEVLAALEEALRCISIARDKLEYYGRDLAEKAEELEKALNAKVAGLRRSLEEMVKKHVAERIVDEVMDCYRHATSDYDCDPIRIMRELGVRV